MRKVSKNVIFLSLALFFFSVIPTITRSQDTFGIHLECSNGHCVQFQGDSPNKCSTDEDCALTHTECTATNACVVFQGPGTNKCSTNADCGSDTGEIHTECKNNTCQSVPGPGSNQCSTNADCASPPPSTTGYCLINASTGQTGCNKASCSACAGDGLSCVPNPGPNCTGSAVTFAGVPQSVTISPGQTSSFSFTLTQTSGTPSAASFSASGFPTGVTGNFLPASCTPTCTSSLTISVSDSATPGTYTITVTATGIPGSSPTSSFQLVVGSETGGDDGARSIFSCKNPIVPCGRPGTPDCNLCYLYNLTSNIVNFCLFCLILPVSIVALLIGGILLLASRGNPQMLETGKKAIANTLIGVLIAFAAWLIIATIANTLGYKGFTGAWNIAPTCAPSGFGGGGGGEKTTQCKCTCELGGSVFTTKDTATCANTCNAQGIGPMKSCIPVTTPPPPGGKCLPMPTGPCSESNLSSSCFKDVAHEASQICGESGGDPKSESRTDRATGGGCPPPYKPNDCPHSAGLFQINFAEHPIGVLPCPNAFKPINDNGITRYVIVDQALYNKCLAAAKLPQANIATACQIYEAAGNKWSKDWAFGPKCGLP